MKIKVLITVLVIVLLLGVASFFFVSYKKDKAREIILEDVNALESDVEVVSKGTELDGFKLIYEMEFYYQNVKYEYAVNLFTDQIVSRDQEGKTKEEQSVKKDDVDTTKTITGEDAKEIALEDAGVPIENINNVIINEDKENGSLEYDVEFSFDKTRYEYKIDTHGKIVSFEKEPINQ